MSDELVAKLWPITLDLLRKYAEPTDLTSFDME